MSKIKEVVVKVTTKEDGSVFANSVQFVAEYDDKPLTGEDTEGAQDLAEQMRQSIVPKLAEWTPMKHIENKGFERAAPAPTKAKEEDKKLPESRPCPKCGGVQDKRLGKSGYPWYKCKNCEGRFRSNGTEFPEDLA